MIFEIVEMVLKEVRHRDRKDMFGALEAILEEVNDEAVSILTEHEKRERWREEDDNKNSKI